MNKEELTRRGYKYIATQNSESKLELWAKFTGYDDIVEYLYYNPITGMSIDSTKKQESYTHIDLMSQLRDRMREDFVKYNIQYDISNRWIYVAQ